MTGWTARTGYWAPAIGSPLPHHARSNTRLLEHAPSREQSPPPAVRRPPCVARRRPPSRHHRMPSPRLPLAQSSSLATAASDNLPSPTTGSELLNTRRRSCRLALSSPAAAAVHDLSSCRRPPHSRLASRTASRRRHPRDRAPLFTTTSGPPRTCACYRPRMRRGHPMPASRRPICAHAPYVLMGSCTARGGRL